MQWNKAKTIMIVLFLLLNIALAYLNISRSNVYLSDTENDELVRQSALMRLAESGLVLRQEPLHFAENMGALLLAEQNCLGTPQQIAHALFGSQELQADAWRTLSGGEQWRFCSDEATLEVSDDGRWVYRLNGTLAKADAATATASAAEAPTNAPMDAPMNAMKMGYDEAWEVAKAFAEQHALMDAFDTRMTSLSLPEQGQYDFIWQRVHRGYTLFDSELLISVRDGAVIMAYSSLRDIREETAPRMRTCSSNDILLRLSQDADLLAAVQEERTAGRSLEIDALELGFFSAYAAKHAEEELLAQPAWRVRLSAGRDIFYSALNGQRVYP